MKIVYDATPLLMRSAGVKNYHYSLLRELLPLAGRHELRLFPFLPGLTPNHNERSNYRPLPTALRLGGLLASNYLATPYARFAARDADLFHATPHLWRLPRGVRWTSMVHDPTPATLPECHTASNVRYFARFAERILPRLEGVITPSEAVRGDLVRLFSLDPARITAIPHGVDEDFLTAGPAEAAAARSKYALPNEYALFVGSIEPRKNLTTLAEAFARLPAPLARRHPLALVATTGWKNEAIRRALAKVPSLHSVGYVERGDLPGVYAGAAAFVLPSRYEGFGMPLLEAMAAGAPVVAGDNSAMPEVVGDCGLLVDVEDATALAEALRTLLEDRERATGLAEAGRRRARGFTWRRSAERTLELFERCGRGERLY